MGKVNVEHAQRIIDAKPSEGQHLYIDEQEIPRDKHIENLFRDLFHGGPLDNTFRINFEVYYQELIGDHNASVKPGIFLDAGYAMTWISRHIGIVSAVPCKPRRDWGRDFKHVRYAALISSPYADDIPTAYAPSLLHAVLLAAVFVYRRVASHRLDDFFSEALKTA